MAFFTLWAHFVKIKSFRALLTCFRVVTNLTILHTIFAFVLTNSVFPKFASFIAYINNNLIPIGTLLALIFFCAVTLSAFNITLFAYICAHIKIESKRSTTFHTHIILLKDKPMNAFFTEAFLFTYLAIFNTLRA